MPLRFASLGAVRLNIYEFHFFDEADRRPLLDYWCETGEDLSHLVRHVLIHEIGHHFGLSDDDMERLEASAED